MTRLPSSSTRIVDRLKATIDSACLCAPCHVLAESDNPTLPVFSAKEGARRAKALVRTANDCGVNHLAGLKVLPICYASRGNALVIRADGRLNKCTVALQHKRNQIGRIREDGLLDIHNAKLRPWLRGLQSRRPSELQCPLRGLEASNLRGDRVRLPDSPRPGPTP